MGSFFEEAAPFPPPPAFTGDCLAFFFEPMDFFLFPSLGESANRSSSSALSSHFYLRNYICYDDYTFVINEIYRRMSCYTAPTLTIQYN